MEKMKMHSMDKVADNLEKLAAIFPNCITETMDECGGVKRTVDFDILRQELSNNVVEGLQERYQFTWPDKKKAMLAANAPINKTLRPCREESVDFDNTENLYIEGDNLEVLKLLQETYLGKIKMIYIDPPYNTGNDFVYSDVFSQNAADYMENSGQYNEDGNQMVQNTESNGRFHTDWLNMMYPRLKIAKDLLTKDGIIFISIDDNEVENLKKICNEIFGEWNFEGHIHWRRRHNQPNDKTKMIGKVAEHILSYAKDSVYYKKAGVGKIPLTAKFSNPDNDPKGPWASKPWKTGSDQNGSRYTIVSPAGDIFDEEWMGEEKTFKCYLQEGRIYFPNDGKGLPRKKYYEFERIEEGQCATNWWPHEQFGDNQGANDLLTSLFGVKNVFSNPKPIELMEGLLRISNTKNDDLVLDFFSGSASMAHAVLSLNAENHQYRHFIMVQLQDDLDEALKKADAKGKESIKKAISFLDLIDKPHRITEIGKERIRRAGQKIKEENPLTTQELDIGFRVLKLDSSNMKDIYYTPKEYMEKEISLFVDNVKSDRSSEDLLFQVMLDLGTSLASKIVKKEIAGKEVFDVATGHIMACFDKDVNDDVITAIAKEKPSYFVMRDSSLADDSVAINFDQIFNTYSPNTERRVI